MKIFEHHYVVEREETRISPPLFSLHFIFLRIVELGATLGIRPGDFFGPVSAAHCLKQALQAAVELNQVPDTLRIYISQDAIIYREDVMNLCTAPFNLIKQKLNRSIDT
ncbi:unnamed protein product, partial [Rotaria magnacalcarata]